MTAAEQLAFKKRLTRAVLIEAGVVALGALLAVATGNALLLIPAMLLGAIPVVKVALDKSRAARRAATVE